MSIAGVVDLYRGRPHNPVGADGRMALADHLRELRARIIRSVSVLVVTFIVALFFYDQLLQLVIRPYHEAVEILGGKVDAEIVMSGVSAPLMLQLKLCGIAAIVVSSPYWLLQIWGFLVPGLTGREKHWTRVFAFIAGPLFIAGVALGYYVLPKGVQVLLNFTPEGVKNLQDFGEFFTFMTRMLLVFGVAMEIPLFVVLLNLAGVLSGKMLARHRPWIVLGTFIFAAVATPSTDPFSMLMLAIPMMILFFIAEAVARIIDARRGRGKDSTDQWADDEISPL